MRSTDSLNLLQTAGSVAISTISTRPLSQKEQGRVRSTTQDSSLRQEGAKETDLDPQSLSVLQQHVSLKENCTHVRDSSLGFDVIRCESIDYVGDGEEHQVLNLYLPSHGKAPLPAVVWVAGSGFRGHDAVVLGSENWPCMNFATDGIACIDIKYRGDPFPVQHQDVRAAIRWVRGQGNLGQYGLGGKIGVMGLSSGATLAAHAWATAHLADEDIDPEMTPIGPFAAESPAVEAAVVFGLKIYLTPSDQPGCILSEPRPFAENLNLAEQKFTHNSSAVAAKINPLTYELAQAAPIYLAQGLADDNVSPCNTLEVYQAALSNGIPAHVTFLEDLTHGQERHDELVQNMTWLFFQRYLTDRFCCA